MKYLDREFFGQDTVTVARALLGCRLIYKDCAGLIVETEAYRDDPASHAVTRPNKGSLLRETYGHIYIYFIYGMYHCLNFTTEKDGVGAVLIRALEPVAGMAQMQKRRGMAIGKNLTDGPGKLFQAFGFDPAQHNEVIGQSIQLQQAAGNRQFEIGVSRRIGISKATDLEWRFFMKDNPYISRLRL